MLWLYDLTGGVRIGKRHRRVKRAEALAHLPTLRTDRLVAGFLYYDARADDARLTLALLRTAVLDHGAVAANYARGHRAPHRASGGGWRGSGCGRLPARVGPHRRVRDQGGGGGERHRGVGRRRARLRRGGPPPVAPAGQGGPRHRPRRQAARSTSPPSSRCPATAVRSSSCRGPRAACVYLGTTDTDYDGPLDDPACTPEDVDYLLGAVNAATSSAVTRADVTGVWAGLRPLLAPPPGGRERSARTADLSRRHTVHTSRQGLVTVTGGKLTTYRKMAEDTMAQVVAALPADRGAGPCVTRGLRLRGAPRPGDRVASAGRPAGERPPGLALRHRGRPGAGRWPKGGPSCSSRWSRGWPTSAAEVVYAARCEMATSVDDVLSRRTRALLQAARPSAQAAARVAELLAPELGLDACRDGRARRRGSPTGPWPSWRRPASRPRRRPGRHRDRPPPHRPRSTPTPRRSSTGWPAPGPPSTTGCWARSRPAAPRCAPATPTGGRPGATGGRWPSAGPPGARSRPGRRRWCARPTPPRWPPPWPPARRPACRSPPMAGRSGVCGGSVPVFGGVSLDCTGLVGPVVVDEASLVADVPAGLFGPDLEAALRAVGDGLHPRPLPPVDGPVHGRRLAGLSRGGPVLHPLREDRGHGGRPRGGPGRRDRGAHRGRRPPGGHRPQPHPAVRGQRRHPWGDHLGPPAGPPPAPCRRAPGLRLRLLRRRPRGVPPDPAAGRHPGRAAPLRPGRVRAELRPTPAAACSSCSTRPTRACSRPPWPWWTQSARGASARATGPGRPVAGAPQRRLGPGPAVAGRHRRRHGGGGRAVVGPPGPGRRRRGGARDDPGDPGGLGPPVPRLPRRGLPVLHLRRPRPRRRAGRSGRWPGRRTTTGGPGTP